MCVFYFARRLRAAALGIKSPRVSGGGDAVPKASANASTRRRFAKHAGLCIRDVSPEGLRHFSRLVVTQELGEVHRRGRNLGRIAEDTLLCDRIAQVRYAMRSRVFHQIDRFTERRQKIEPGLLPRTQNRSYHTLDLRAQFERRARHLIGGFEHPAEQHFLDPLFARGRHRSSARVDEIRFLLHREDAVIYQLVYDRCALLAG